MLGFIIQLLLQAFVVMMVISFLVFLGVYAIGNPIDVLISPDADQRIREMVIRQYGLDLPLWQQYLGFLHRPPAGGVASKFIMGLSILGFSVPTFWVGLVLIFTFAVMLGWLPAGGRGDTVALF